MASPSPSATGEAGHSVKRDRKRIYCEHCQKEVSKFTYYRHKRQRLAESQLSDDCNDDPKFVWLDDEEVNVIIGDHTSAVENSAPLPIEVSCGRHKNLGMHGSRISIESIYVYG